MKKLSVALFAVLLLVPLVASAAKKEEKVEEPETKLNSDTLSGLKLRGIGPALELLHSTRRALASPCGNPGGAAPLESGPKP